MKVIFILFLLSNVVLLAHSGVMARELNMPEEAKASNGDQFGQDLIGPGKGATGSTGRPGKTTPYCGRGTPYTRCITPKPSPCGAYRKGCPPPATK